MRLIVLKIKLRVEIEDESRVFLENLDFEIELRVSQKSVGLLHVSSFNSILQQPLRGQRR